jgi:hypothetical protein
MGFAVHGKTCTLTKLSGSPFPFPQEYLAGSLALGPSGEAYRRADMLNSEPFPQIRPSTIVDNIAFRVRDGVCRALHLEY